VWERDLSADEAVVHGVCPGTLLHPTVEPGVHGSGTEGEGAGAAGVTGACWMVLCGTHTTPAVGVGH
jgi:hypothetical protein